MKKKGLLQSYRDSQVQKTRYTFNNLVAQLAFLNCEKIHSGTDEKNEDSGSEVLRTFRPDDFPGIIKSCNKTFRKPSTVTTF